MPCQVGEVSDYGPRVRRTTWLIRMADATIAAIELHHIGVPTRREHIWPG